MTLVRPDGPETDNRPLCDHIPCSEPFEPVNARQRFCTDNCRKRDHEYRKVVALLEGFVAEFAKRWLRERWP